MTGEVVLLDDFLKKIGSTITKIFSYGNQDGVSAKDICKKLDDKKLLAELSYETFEQLIDCRKVILKQLKSETDSKKNIISKLSAIEKVVCNSSTKLEKLRDNQKLNGDAIKEMQKELKSYSAAVMKSKSVPVDLKKIERVVKKTVVEVHNQRDRTCNVMVFGFDKASCNIESAVKDMVKELGTGDESNLLKVERVGTENLEFSNDRILIDRRPIKASFGDSVSGKQSDKICTPIIRLAQIQDNFYQT